MENPILMSADLRGEYESLWTEFAKERARVSRLNTELGEKDTLDQKLLADVPVPPSRKAEIVSVEAEHLRTEQADYEREKAFLQHSIKQGDEQIKVLSEQNTKEEQGMQADAEQLQRTNDLSAKDPELQRADAVELALRLDQLAGRDKAAQRAGFEAQTEPTVARASAGTSAQEIEPTANAPAGNAPVTPPGPAESAPNPAPNAATA